MRFMVLVKPNKDLEAGVVPDLKELVEMGKFNDELVKAGVLLAAEGLQSSALGKRFKFAPGGKITITDGPFTETKELVAGFWMVEMKSMDEVVAWFKRCPPQVGEIEIRQVFDSAEFEAVISTPEGRATLAAEDELRNRAKKDA